MAINFPASPVHGQQFIGGGVVWSWDATGSSWKSMMSGIDEANFSNASEWVPNFTAAGEVRIYANNAMTVTEQGTSGTGTVTYEKSTAAAPDTFAATTSPITLEMGAWLKVIATSVTTMFAVALQKSGTAATPETGTETTSATGTTFPTSPVTDQRFYRTDRRIEYLYDGTRWLSTQVFTETVALQDVLKGRTATGLISRHGNSWSSRYSFYLEEFVANYIISGTGTWTIDLQNATGTVLAAASANVAGRGATRVALNTVVADTNVDFAMYVTELTGTSTIYAMGTIIYRLVG